MVLAQNLCKVASRVLVGLLSSEWGTEAKCFTAESSHGCWLDALVPPHGGLFLQSQLTSSRLYSADQVSKDNQSVSVISAWEWHCHSVDTPTIQWCVWILCSKGPGCLCWRLPTVVGMRPNTASYCWAPVIHQHVRPVLEILPFIK